MASAATGNPDAKRRARGGVTPSVAATGVAIAAEIALQTCIRVLGAVGTETFSPKPVIDL